MGLVLGLVVGLAVGPSPAAPLQAFTKALEAVGTMWVNGIRMTVIPLVLSLIIAAIATEKDLGTVGRMGRRLFAIFVGLLSIGALLGFVFAPQIIRMLDIDATAAASLRGAAAPTAAAAQLPTF